MHEKRDDQFEHMDVYELKAKARVLVKELESTTIERNKLDSLVESKQGVIGVSSRALAEANEKLTKYEAGVDETPPVEGVVPTPGQLWYQLLNAREDVRLAILVALQNNADTAMRCFAMDHQGLMQQLEVDREQLSIAVFDMPTQDNTPMLITAVRALRQVMVDGIARRATVVDDAIDKALDDYDEEFPREAGTQEKIVATLKEKGIDLQSVCGYEWMTDDEEHVHLCGLINPLHADAHDCGGFCRATLSHEDAERMAAGG